MWRPGGATIGRSGSRSSWPTSALHPSSCALASVSLNCSSSVSGLRPHPVRRSPPNGREQLGSSTGHDPPPTPRSRWPATYRHPVIVVQGDAFNASGLATVVVVLVTSNLRWAAAPGNVLLPSKHTGLFPGLGRQRLADRRHRPRAPGGARRTPRRVRHGPHAVRDRPRPRPRLTPLKDPPR